MAKLGFLGYRVWPQVWEGSCNDNTKFLNICCLELDIWLSQLKHVFYKHANLSLVPTAPQNNLGTASHLKSQYSEGRDSGVPKA